MATFKIDLDQETYVRLVEQAVAERRPIHWQAEIILMHALRVLSKDRKSVV